MKNKFSSIKKTFKNAISGSKKTKDSKNTEAKTLALTKWIDFDGNVHYDYDQCTLVKAYRPKGFNDPEKRKTFKPVIKKIEFAGNYYKGLAVPGTIIKVGSSVQVATNLSANKFASIEDDIETLDIFKNAVNLVHTYQCFRGAGSKLKTIPNGLFRNCHKLKLCVCTFEDTAIESIPSDLFKGCHDLISVGGCFSDCKNLTDVDEAIFSNNNKIKIFRGCFSGTGLTGIPENLFNSVSGKDIWLGKIFADCTNLTDIPKPFIKKLSDKSTIENAFAKTAFAKGCIEGDGQYNGVSVFDYFPKGTSTNKIASALGISGD